MACSSRVAAATTFDGLGASSSEEGRRRARRSRSRRRRGPSARPPRKRRQRSYCAGSSAVQLKDASRAPGPRCDST
eukprot:4862244-Pyramimonas_sp.AAC.1